MTKSQKPQVKVGSVWREKETPAHVRFGIGCQTVVVAEIRPDGRLITHKLSGPGKKLTSVTSATNILRRYEHCYDRP